MSYHYGYTKFRCSFINVPCYYYILCTIPAIMFDVEEVVGSGSTSGTVAGIATCIHCSPVATAK